MRKRERATARGRAARGARGAARRREIEKEEARAGPRRRNASRQRGARKGERRRERRRNKSGKNESIGGVFHDMPLEALQVGVRNRRSQADLGPPFCDNGREGVCLSDWLIYGLLSSWTSFYRLFGCTHRRVLQPPGNPVTPLPHTAASPTPYPHCRRCALSLFLPPHAAAVSSRAYTHVRYVHAYIRKKRRVPIRVAEKSSRKIASVLYSR